MVKGSSHVHVTSLVERPVCRQARRLCETRNPAGAHRSLRRRYANRRRTRWLRVVVFRFPPARRLVVGTCFLHQATAGGGRRAGTVRVIGTQSARTAADSWPN